MIIRTAIPAEREASKLCGGIFANEGDREALERPDAVICRCSDAAGGVVAEDSGALVGFSAILPREDGDTELDALFVEPGIQRRGVGRLLVEHCAKAARLAGSSALHVVGNPHAKQFYLACGFDIVGTFQTRFGPGLLLRKAL